MRHFFQQIQLHCSIDLSGKGVFVFAHLSIFFSNCVELFFVSFAFVVLFQVQPCVLLGDGGRGRKKRTFFGGRKIFCQQRSRVLEEGINCLTKNI